MDSTLTTWAPLVIMALIAVWWIFRAVRRTPRLWRTKLAVGFVVVTVALTYLTGGGWATYLRTKGWTTTEATIQDVETQMVTKTELRAHRRSVTTHERLVREQTLEVSYTADGQAQTWTGRFDEWHNKGETILVRYDPDKPTSIVEVTATSDELTPFGTTTNSTVSSIAGMPTFALVTLGTWIAAIPFLAVLLATWLVPRRRQDTPDQGEYPVQEYTVPEDPGRPQPHPPAYAWRPAPGACQPGTPSPHQPDTPGAYRPGTPGPQPEGSLWSSRSVPPSYPPQRPFPYRSE